MNLSEFTCWFCFLFISIVLLVILAAIYNISQCYDKPDKCENIDIDTVKTGDILATSYNQINGYFISGWSQSSWSHTGLVWRDPKTNIPYVLEVCRYKDPNYRGYVKIPLIKWLRYNKKSLKCIMRYHGDKLNEHKILDKFNDLSTSELQGFRVTWNRFLRTKKYEETLWRSEGNAKAYTCFEVTIILLQDAGVYSKEFSCCSFFPGSILNHKIEVINGYYDNPIEIRFNSKWI